MSAVLVITHIIIMNFETTVSHNIGLRRFWAIYFITLHIRKNCMNYKLIFITVAVVSILAGYFAFRKTGSVQREMPTFIVGTAAGYAPFVSINAEGDYEGFDIDVAQSLAQKMGKKLVIKDLGSMAPLFIALDQGSIDAIIWGLSITQERLKKVAMIRYQGETTKAYPLIFWQKIPSGIKRIDDMKGMTVCVEPASCQDALLSKYAFISKKLTEKVDDALLNIRYGKADAALVEPAIAKKFKVKFPEIQILEVPLSQEDQVPGIGIALKKKNTVLGNQLQKAVNDLQSAGIVKQYQEKWGVE